MKPLALPSEWPEKAGVLLADAKRHLEKGHYWLTCFDAQQAAELYLKALLVSLTGLHPFTHDLVELLEALKSIGFSMPSKHYTYADALTPHHTMARYPGKKPVKYDKSLAERCTRYAREIIKWVEKQAFKTHGLETEEKDELLQAYVEELRRTLSASIIMLSGSRARGSHLPYSDYDVTVVVKEVGNKLRRLKPKGLDLDLLVVSFDELGDPLVKTCSKTPEYYIMV